MKSFVQFLQEAAKTSAATQAQQRGLVGDGHGGWYDRQGKFVAKTVDGKLKFSGGRNSKTDDAPSQGKPQKPAEPTSKKTAAAPAPVATGSAKSSGEDENTKKSDSKETDQVEIPDTDPSQYDGVVVVFGRFNPPTTGHQKLLQRAKSEASRKNFALKVYPSRTQDKKKNPLEPGTKIEYMKKMFDDVADDIIDDPEAKTIFDVMVAANELGFSRLTIMVGQDRLSEFQSLAHKYNGDLYEFEEIEVVSAGTRDADAEGLEGMSASKMRKAAADGDFKAFVKGIPNLGNMEKKELFNNIRKSMGSEAKSESYVWEIAPKLDEYNLRETYRRGDLFPIGALVENLNTGETGRITRRGTNHVICMTPEGTMFKSWLRDLAEAYEIGTDDYREYVQSMSAGQPVRKFGEPKKRIKPTILPLKPNDPKKHK